MNLGFIRKTYHFISITKILLFLLLLKPVDSFCINLINIAKTTRLFTQFMYTHNVKR